MRNDIEINYKVSYKYQSCKMHVWLFWSHVYKSIKCLFQWSIQHHWQRLKVIRQNKSEEEHPVSLAIAVHFIILLLLFFFHALVYLIENYTKLRWWSSWCAPNNMWKHSENKFVCFCFNAECSFVVPIYFTTHRKDLWKNINRSVLLHRTSLIKECNDTLK